MGNHSYNAEQEFGGIDFNSSRLESRFKRTMESLMEQPDKSIWLSSGSRSEAKAVYRMLGNEKLNSEEILRCHREATIERMTGHRVILAVQDTTGINYAGHAKMEGLGYNCDKTLGINIHSCLAVTPEGLVLGVLSQTSYTREIRKDESANHDKKKRRPIEEKESYRWLEALEKSDAGIPPEIKVIHVCDREGDMYELFSKAADTDRFFLMRIVQNRPTVDNERIVDAMKSLAPMGSIEALIPRDSRRNIAERKAQLDISFRSFDVKKPVVRKADKHLMDHVTMNALYVKERKTDESMEPIEWLLATNEPISCVEDAYEKIEYYMQRWKIERFHYVLKSGCNVEKIQQRSVHKVVTLILMYSIISVRILCTTYLARIWPQTPCSTVFEKNEWTALYRTANKTKIAPVEPYSICDAVKYVAQLGGFLGAKSDGAPGLKVIWMGFIKLYTILSHLKYLV